MKPIWAMTRIILIGAGRRKGRPLAESLPRAFRETPPSEPPADNVGED